MKNLSETRNLFESRISKYVRNYRTLSDVSKLKTISDLHPHCKHESQCQAIEGICTFVENTGVDLEERGGGEGRI